MDAFVWDQSGIRIIGIMQVSVRLGALPIPEYYSAPRSRMAGIYSRIYSYSRIFSNDHALNCSVGSPVIIHFFLFLPFFSVYSTKEQTKHEVLPKQAYA